MAIVDTNKVIRAYLVAQTALIALVGQRIYIPRLPENAALPAISFFTRGGTSTPYIPGELHPSVQFDCWSDNTIEARQVYGLLYDALQGIQNIDVLVDGTTYKIWGAEEEVQGQDLQDIEIPTYFKVLTFFSFMIKAE